jgi:anaerobic selenocysteine-containing dehydrogenase
MTEESLKVVRTFAWSAGPGCHGGCGVEVYLRGNKVVKVEGDPGNPWSQGRICARCLAMTQYLYHPQRLLHPMKRTGERGENKWQRISWDEAFDTIERKFREVTSKYGPESIVFAQGTGRDIGGAITLLAYSVGSPNWIQLGLSGHACYTPRLAAAWTVVNDFVVLDASQWLEKRYDDPEYTIPKYIINWGVDLPNTCPDGFFNHWIVDLMKRGSKLIVVDPRVTWLASRSEVHLRVRSGTDAALALSMLNTIIKEKLYDKEFVERWTNAPFLVRTDTRKLLRESDITEGGRRENFVVWDESTGGLCAWSSSEQAYLQVHAKPALEGSYDAKLADGSTVKCETAWTALKERVSEFSPEKTADTCWIDKDDIVKAARLYAKNKPSAIHWGVALDHIGPDAVPASRTIALLWCVTGNLDVPGGDVIARYAYNVTVYPFRGEATSGLTLPPSFYTKRSGVWKYPILKNFRSWGLSDTALQQMLTGEPYPIKAIWIQTCNPVSGQSPEPAKFLDAMKKMDFVAVVDAFMTPTAVACADIVLPVSTFVERWGLRSWWTPLEAMAKAVEPLEEAKSDYEINLELAKRFNPKLQWKNVQEMFNDYLKPAGVTYDELCKKVWMLAPKGNPSRPYYRYKTGLLRPDGKEGFATPSGKVELWSSLLEDWGLDPLPHYEEPPFSPYSTPELAKEYPLILGTGRRSYAFFHSEHRQIPWLREIDRDPVVEINPETAAKLRIKNGDWVWLENQLGKCRRVALVTPIVPSWMVMAPHSWWLPEKSAEGPSLFGTWDVNVNQLVPYGYVGEGGLGAPYKTMLCRVRKVEQEEM